jgi:uncharacterized protein (DUF697 family)/tellurite resistance protein
MTEDQRMNENDHLPIVTIAFLAAMADGRTTPDEDARLRQVLSQLGIGNVEVVAQPGTGRLASLAARLSSDEARRQAYETALVVCTADGAVNDAERAFLDALRQALGLSADAVAQIEQQAAALAGTSVAGPVEVKSGEPPSDAAIDQMILRQAMLTAAVEILPDKLANVVILPLQLRLVYQIGQEYGQRLDLNQVKDLAATLGLGAAAQVMEGVVRKLARGVAGGLLGGVIGGVGGLAAGAAVTFASTYALGHVAKQYYAQGRRLSGADLRALFTRFQDDAKTIFPKVENEVRAQAKSLDLQSLLSRLRSV